MLRTVGVSFEKLVPDAAHAAALRDAVCRVHGCTMLATELLNLYVRDRLENHGGSGLEHVMEGNWLLNAYYEVTRASERRKAKVEPALRATRDAHASCQRPFFDLKRHPLATFHRTPKNDPWTGLGLE